MARTGRGVLLLGLAMCVLGCFEAARGRVGRSTFGSIEGPQAIGAGIAMALVGAYGVLLTLRQAIGRTWYRTRLVMLVAGSMGATGVLALILRIVDAGRSSMATCFVASMTVLLLIGLGVQHRLDRLPESPPDKNEEA